MAKKAGILGGLGAAAALLLGTAIPADGDGVFWHFDSRDGYVYNSGSPAVIYPRPPLPRCPSRYWPRFHHSPQRGDMNRQQEREMKGELRTAQEDVYLNSLANYLDGTGFFDEVERDMDPEADVIIQGPNRIRGYNVDIIAKRQRETFIFDTQPGRFNKGKLAEQGVYIINVRNHPSQESISQELARYGIYTEDAEVVNVR